MNAKDAIRTVLTSTRDLLSWYVADLSDEDLLVRPTAGANHIAWQLGHLVDAERRLGAQLPGVAYPELPASFAEQHSKDTAAAEPPRHFRTKAEYLDLFSKVREATLAALAAMSDADLDKPTSGGMAKFAPTMGDLLVLTGNHTMMHAGQFSVTRRALGKPVLF